MKPQTSTIHHLLQVTENYVNTFNHFLLNFIRYLCNFCPNTCSQEAILIKVSYLGVVTLSTYLSKSTKSEAHVPIQGNHNIPQK